MNHNVIDKSNAIINRTDFYFVSLKNKETGEEIKNLEPKRLFPVTMANNYIVLVDETETEVALIRDLDDLDDKSRIALSECLEDNYRIPKIIKIHKFTDHHRLIWYCETDKGETKFHIHRIRQDIRFWGKKVLIRDYLDNRYVIEDYTKLDKQSTKILNTFT